MSEGKFEGQERTEEPTPRREEKFREEGQVPQSQEIASLMTLAAAIIGFSMAGGTIVRAAIQSVESCFAAISTGSAMVGGAAIVPIISEAGKALLGIMIAMFIASAVSSIAQTRFLIAWKAATPKMERLSVSQGIKRVISWQMIVNFLKNLLKAIIIGWIFYSVMKGRIHQIVNIGQMPIHSALVLVLELIAKLFTVAAGFLVVIAVGDYVFNYFQIRKKMMMSREELKEEMKESQLPDTVRGKMRQAQMEASRRTIEKEVPKADVVITNPTHFAVALRYVRGEFAAPRVVAKGADLLAKRIREIAKENNVVIYEEPPLARELYKKVKVGKEIPRELFKAVARILAYVYNLRQKTRRNSAEGVRA